MNYVVLYNGVKQISNGASIGGATYVTSGTELKMIIVTTEEEAITFAQKNDGVILLPATINSKIQIPKDIK